MGYAAAIVVAVMVIASITLLPALLGFAGMKLASSSLPWAKAREAREARERAEGVAATGGWQRWGTHVARHPWNYLVASAAVLLVMAVPLLSMRLGQTDAGSNPQGHHEPQGLRPRHRGLRPGHERPAAAVGGPHRRRRGRRPPTCARSSTALRADEDVLFAPDAEVNADGDAAVVTVIPKSAPAGGRDGRRSSTASATRSRPRPPASTPTSAA